MKTDEGTIQNEMIHLLSTLFNETMHLAQGLSKKEVEYCSNLPLGGRVVSFSLPLEAPKNARLWKTIEIGTFSNGPALAKAIRSRKRSEWVIFGGEKDASILVDQVAFPTASRPESVGLAIATPRDLGFGRRNAGYRAVCGRAIVDAGLELCLPEVAPQLRLQWLEQPIGERLYVAMRPVPIFGVPCIFAVTHDSDGIRRIGGVPVYDQPGRGGGIPSCPDTKFVFTVPRRWTK